MVKDDSTVRCFQGLLIFGNVITGMCGIALTAECIFFVSDQHSLYPLLEATNNDDIYGAAWIGMFVGICLFCLSVLGIVGIVKSNRKILLAYFILMFIVYGFEVASCITAATQRDFFTPNLFLKQMLERYQNNSPPTNDDQWKNNGVTRTWDRLMLQPELQREAETERKVFHLLVHFPDGRNGWSYADLKPATRSFLRVSHASAGAQALGPSSTAFPGHSRELDQKRSSQD
ncbi:uroplakin-1b isoform X2 [Oryctolagus cuniculus]|uniref:uroplakin-1b isoform X2 n=1 Tax=Oryctolagus cuniculus TaxID=9986 RepID=UPI00387A4330